MSKANDADVAELADAPGLGPGAFTGVGVRVPPSARNDTGPREAETSGPWFMLVETVELAHLGVTANVVNPGATDTGVEAG